MKLNNCMNLLENLGVRNLTVLGAKKSREILESVAFRFAGSLSKKEIINYHSFISSDLIRRIYLNVMSNAKSYVYTAEKGAQLIGVNAKDSLSKCLNIAKNSIEKTCYIVCADFTYHFRINYLNEEDVQGNDSFIIEMSNS